MILAAPSGAPHARGGAADPIRALDLASRMSPSAAERLAFGVHSRVSLTAHPTIAILRPPLRGGSYESYSHSMVLGGLLETS